LFAFSSHCSLLSQASNPLAAEKNSNPIKFGILGAARIAPNALITPALSHPDVVVYAVAARAQDKADKFARKYGIEKVYAGSEGYQRTLAFSFRVPGCVTGI